MTIAAVAVAAFLLGVCTPLVLIWIFGVICPYIEND
jgi:hypothetical protein